MMVLAFILMLAKQKWWALCELAVPACISLDGIRRHGACWKTYTAYFTAAALECLMWWALLKAL